MSATATRMPSREAASIARRFIDLIEDATDRLVVAGSLRRRLPTCGDIEVVCIANVETVTTTEPGLFEDVVTETQVDRLHERMEQLLADGVVQKRLLADGLATRWGPKNKLLLFEDRPIDLFGTSVELWGWTLVIRTGPAEFSCQLVQARGEKTKHRRAGLLPSHLFIKDGLHSRMSGQLIPTHEEDEVFRTLGLDYQAPWERR